METGQEEVTKRFFNKDDMIWNLESLISHVAKQTDEKWRWKFFGEAISIIKSLILIGWFKHDEGDDFKCRLTLAFNRSLQKDGACDSGEKPQKRWDFCLKTHEKCVQCKNA